MRPHSNRSLQHSNHSKFTSGPPFQPSKSSNSHPTRSILPADPAMGSYSRFILTSFLRLAPTLGIYSLTSCDWFPIQVFTHFSPALGSHSRYILTSFLRWVYTPGIYALPSCDEFPLQLHTQFPPAMSFHSRYILSFLMQLVPTPGIYFPPAIGSRYLFTSLL